MQIKYDKEVKELLRAAGYSDAEIRQQEVRSSQHANDIFNQPSVEPQPSDQSIQRKMMDDDLTPVGANRVS